MAEVVAEELAKVDSFPKLVKLLRDKLDWPINEGYEFDEITFEYEPKDLGLKPEEAAKVREIHQLRPLITGQPWGIFFLSFDEKAMSVTVLRRVLRELVVKQRASGQSATQAAWQKEDLIFVAGFGNSGERELAFVHFCDNASTGDLPVMKVLGWSAKDTTLHNRNAGQMLSQRLVWPDDVSDFSGWRDRWASAFEVAHREVITTSRDLAVRLAALASEIRARANQLLEAETDQGPMQTMLAAFRRNLIHELNEDGFADMFAQTIAYGLLAARISRPMGIIADNLADMVPKTNPFLKELFGNFLRIGGRDKRAGLDFDELGVRDVVDVLNKANMEAVLRDFGNRNPKKDPVIHFYEDFLREYDREQKVDAGIFYTPPAVVGFIVRGIDEMLRTEFSLPLGLADTSTWAEVAERNDRITIPAHVKPDAPFVQILDPATGTGTFLVEVIDLIHKRMGEHWKAQGKSVAEIKAAWNLYVPAHLLPRLTAFELKMAAYTIAHMKVGLKLTETGYSFGSDERLHVLLTNSLQPATELDLEERMRLAAMAHEAERANFAKEHTPFTVVIGNPPYKGHSMNPSRVKGKLTFAGEIIQRFFQVRGEALGEKNPKWLNNDYVKFIALGMRYIERTGVGALGYITSNSWLDSPTFRGVRTEVIDSFSILRILDLHGHIKKKETAIDGTLDEGVFAIEEGTNITIAARLTALKSIKKKDLLGRVGEGDADNGKFGFLQRNNLNSVDSAIEPRAPFFVLAETDSISGAEYASFESVRVTLPVGNLGYQTHRDHFAVALTEEEMLGRVKALQDKSILDEEIESRYQIKSNRDWKIFNARVFAASRTSGQLISRTCYRPFDIRYSGLNAAFMDYPRPGFFGSVEVNEIAINICRQQARVGFQHVLVSDLPAESCYVSDKTREGSYYFPLWLKPSAGESHHRPNIDRSWAHEVGKVVGLAYEDAVPRGEQQSFGQDFRLPKVEQLGLLDTPWDGRGDLTRFFGPRDLFDYMYAVLHSPGYRNRYAEFLKSDFPRIPTPTTSAGFADLVLLGRQLVALHLLRLDDAPTLKAPEIRFAGNGEARVEKGYPEYKNGKVMISASRWFEDVPKATWEFHVGGYQVCEKWLKDRAAKGGKKPSEGRVLTEEDILHYRRVVVSLTETRRLMAEIDVEIEKHGGWPAAFVVGE